MKIPKNKDSNGIVRPSRPRKTAWTVGSALTAVCLAMNALSAETLMVFNFNEGTGTNTTSADGKLVGTFVVTNGPPTFTNDTPSGLAGDFALQFAAGQRVTVPDPNKVLALDTNDRSFTIQAWLKFTTPSGRAVFFYNNGPG